MKKMILGAFYCVLCLTIPDALAARPVLAHPISNQSWSGSGSKSYRFPLNSFTDVDGDLSSYSARLSNGNALPSWLRFSSSLRRFYGNPPYGAATLSLRVTAKDVRGGTASDTFLLSFSSTNDTPIASAGSLTVQGGQTVTENLTALDGDGDRLTYRIVRNGAQGTVSLLSTRTGSYTYTPKPGATGTDSFTFKVYDGHVYSNTATVTVTLLPAPNQPPVAADGTLTLASGSGAGSGVLSASDADGDTLNYQILAQGSKGVVTITDTATGAYTYTPNAGVTGTDTFTFLASDGSEDSNTATVTVSLAASGGDGLVTNTLGMSFKRIPAGSFTMGSPDSEAGHHAFEGPQHPVTLTQDFYMQTTEVTQGQWSAIMGNNPSWFSFRCTPDCPVEQVTVSDIQTFLTLLNARGEGTYRLPTEAEWEYAARAGTTTAYSFGADATDIREYGWFGYDDNAGVSTHPVGEKQPNAWGLYDMHGNVWEWVEDRYAYYTSASATDPVIGPVTGQEMRICRGGSWGDSIDVLRSAYRHSFDYTFSSSHVGFRLVKEP